MTDQRRFVLWANDSPLNACDAVRDMIIAELEQNLDEAIEDSCFINDVVAYARCLTGVCDWGSSIVEAERIQSWCRRAVAVIENMDSHYYDTESEQVEEIEFIKEVFNDLLNVVNRA